ncbi:MAG: hypothetical protein FJ304_04160 [Planctomycetes bacterium]|nr:hypothetical protein [Planctomycetota bacterium]
MFTAITLSLCTVAAGDKVGGWPELFPELQNFERKVAAPVVAKGEKPAAYSQATTYEWLGGRFEVLTVTIAHDPAFKVKYTAEAMKKAKYEKLEVSKRTAYQWDRMKSEMLDTVNKRLVVILADDKVLIVEQRGAGLELDEVAKKLDFEKVAKALEGAPPAAK